MLGPVLFLSKSGSGNYVDYLPGLFINKYGAIYYHLQSAVVFKR